MAVPIIVREFKKRDPTAQSSPQKAQPRSEKNLCNGLKTVTNISGRVSVDNIVEFSFVYLELLCFYYRHLCEDIIYWYRYKGDLRLNIVKTVFFIGLKKYKGIAH